MTNMTQSETSTLLLLPPRGDDGKLGGDSPRDAQRHDQWISELQAAATGMRDHSLLDPIHVSRVAGSFNRKPETELREMLIAIVKSLVDDPNEVSVIEDTGPDSICFQIQVADHDLGRVIGKEGRTARAIRLLASANGHKVNHRVQIDIVAK